MLMTSFKKHIGLTRKKEMLDFEKNKKLFGDYYN